MRDSERDAQLTIEQILAYEIAASWWAGWVSSIWLQGIAGLYFAWKARRKWRRYRSILMGSKDEE